MRLCQRQMVVKVIIAVLPPPVIICPTVYAMLVSAGATSMLDVTPRPDLPRVPMVLRTLDLERFKLNG